jgi:predicted transcriptional regulator
MTASDLTPRELDVMAVLWELGEASVADVQPRLGDDLAYTSVLSVLQLLERKGHVTHERVGRRYVYRPATSAREAGGPLLDRLLESLYRRSPVKLVAHLVDRSRMTEDELRQIRELVDRRLGTDGEPRGSRAKGPRTEADR